MTIVDIYCRVATLEGDVLDMQEADCRAYCLEYDLTIGTVYREVAAGLEYRNRQDLAKLRERYKTGQVQGVVIANLDRLSRSSTHLVILMEEMEQHTIPLYVARESTSGHLFRLLRVFAADLEREKALDKNLDGKGL